MKQQTAEAKVGPYGTLTPELQRNFASLPCGGRTLPLGFFFLYWNPSPRSTPPTPIPPHSSWWLVDGGKSLSCSQSHLHFKCGENTRFHVLPFRNTNVAFIGRCFCRRRWRHSLYGLCCAYSRSASSSQLTILVKCEFL